MNVVREIERMNERELELGITSSASWHAQYAHSSYIFIASLVYSLTESDLLAIFSQFGEIVDLHLVRGRDSGASKGFAFLAYEDVRSSVLAIDNMNGFTLNGRVLRVDHADKYRRPKMHESTDRRANDEYAAFDEAMKHDQEYDQRRKLIWDYEAYHDSHTVNASASAGAGESGPTSSAPSTALTANTAASGVTSQIMNSVDLSKSTDPKAQRIAKLMERRRQERMNAR